MKKNKTVRLIKHEKRISVVGAILIVALWALCFFMKSSLASLNVEVERLSRDIYFFPLQLLLNHHETDTYSSLDCCRNDSLVTSWCQRACVCSRAVSEVDHLPIILISTGHTSLGDFRE